MKKILFAILAAAALFTSCKKEDPFGSLGGVVSQRFALNANETVVKSQYTAGEGVVLNGNEDVTVWWVTTDADKLTKIKATGSNFNYSFSHAAIEGASYDYYFVVPNTNTNNQNSKNRYPLVYLNTIQQPVGTTSFDPAQDYLVGQPKFNQEASSSFEVNFKRFFYPLIVSLKDEDALLESGEKIRYVTLATGESTIDYPLIGTAYFQFLDATSQKSDAFADAKIQSWLKDGRANKITAYYPQGQAYEGESFDAWFIVNMTNRNDATFSNVLKGEYELSVVTDKNVYSRTVNFGETGVTFRQGVNSVTLNGIGTKESAAYTQDFTSLTSLSTSLVSSDGVTRTWGFTNITLDKGFGLSLAKDKTHEIALPQRASEKITKIAILPSLKAANNNIAVTFKLMAGETEVVSNININVQNALINAPKGFVEIAVPAAYQTEALTLVRTDQTAGAIRAITVYTSDSGEVDPEPPTPPTPSTYSSMYEQGIEFTVGDIVVNKTNYPTASVVTIGETEVSTVVNTMKNTGGLVFIKGEGTLTLGAAIYNTAGLVVVGDDPTKQPVIDFSDEAQKYFFACRGAGKDYGFKNIAIESKGALTDYIFLADNTATNGGRIGSLNISDCTISTSCNVIQESNKLNTLESAVVENSVIEISGAKSRGLYNCTVPTYGNTDRTKNYYQKDSTSLKKISIKNNVIYTKNSPSNVAMTLVQLTNYTHYDNAVVSVEHNSIYGIWNNGGLINTFTIKDSNFDNNVLEYDYTGSDLNDGKGPKQCYIYNYRKTDDSPKKKFSVDGNYGLATHADQQRVKVFVKGNADKSGSSSWPFNTDIAGSPYSTKDTANGYFPVNTSVVTGGAGASYDTKLWRTWGE